MIPMGSVFSKLRDLRSAICVLIRDGFHSRILFDRFHIEVLNPCGQIVEDCMKVEAAFRHFTNGFLLCPALDRYSVYGAHGSRAIGAM